MMDDLVYLYKCLLAGLDEDADRLIELHNGVIKKANDIIAMMQTAIMKASYIEVGTLIVARDLSDSAEWLLCDGSAIPSQYEELYEMLDGKLPKVSDKSDRYKAYMYAGIV